MIWRDAPNLNSLLSPAVRLDNRMWERKRGRLAYQASCSGTSPAPLTLPRIPPPSTEETPMQIRNTHLPPEEREQQF